MPKYFECRFDILILELLVLIVLLLLAVVNKAFVTENQDLKDSSTFYWNLEFPAYQNSSSFLREGKWGEDVHHSIHQGTE